MGCFTSRVPQDDAAQTILEDQLEEPKKPTKVDKGPPPVYHDEGTLKLFDIGINQYLKSPDNALNDITFIVTDNITNETKEFECIKSIFSLHCPSLKLSILIIL